MIGPTWGELEAAANTVPKKIRFELQHMSAAGADYQRFVDLVERALSYSLGKMVAAKNIATEEQSEDQLTYMLTAPLLGMAFDVSHATNQGGHCDIRIVGDDEMLWLGESKKYTADYGKLMGGYQQLVDRYAPGLSKQLAGGMVIFFWARKVRSVMNEWRSYLMECRDSLKSQDVEGNHLDFRTSEPHGSTELELTVRHFAIPLLHEPTDDKPPPPRRKQGTGASKAKTVN